MFAILILSFFFFFDFFPPSLQYLILIILNFLNKDNSSILHNTSKPENYTQFNFIENFAISRCLQEDDLDQSFRQMNLNQEYKLSSDTEGKIKGLTILILSI